MSQVTGTLCCLAVASSEMEYIAEPSPETASTLACPAAAPAEVPVVSSPTAPPIAAGKPKPSPPAPCAEWNWPSRASQQLQPQYAEIVMSQYVCMSAGTASRTSAMNFSSLARSCDSSRSLTLRNDSRTTSSGEVPCQSGRAS